MDMQKLFELQGRFLADYPEGFDSEDLQQTMKKHRVGKLEELAATEFSEGSFGNPEKVTDAMVKIVSRSSVVSMFEKPKFRDAVKLASMTTRENLAEGLYEQLHGNEELGFNLILEELIQMKLAKWSLISLWPFYYDMQKYWFIKPTTTKNILKHFEVEALIYKPRPSYEFYRDYSAFLTEMKEECDPVVSPNNGAFSGFLMMSIQ